MAIDKYLDNITSEHRDKPKFIAWLSTFLNKIDGGYLCLRNFDDNLDLDNAIGPQLDMLGQIIGRKRTLTFQPLNNFNPVLDDDYYRLVLKTKIAMNNWDGKIPSMYTIWDNIFGNDNMMDLQLQDNQDMSFNAYITGYVDQIQQDLIQHGYIIPKPEGVRVNYIGRSKIDFSVNYAMVVSICKTVTFVMNTDQSEKIYNNNYPYMVVNQIKTETITMSNKTMNFLIDENGDLLLDNEGNKLLI